MPYDMIWLLQIDIRRVIIYLVIYNHMMNYTRDH